MRENDVLEVMAEEVVLQKGLKVFKGDQLKVTYIAKTGVFVRVNSGIESKVVSKEILELITKNVLTNDEKNLIKELSTEWKIYKKPFSEVIHDLFSAGYTLDENKNKGKVLMPAKEKAQKLLAKK